MVEEPLVSIITSAYNREEFIGETIKSVLSQTYRNWEWIIVDDGSTDDTKKIIMSFSEPRIKYYWQNHTGIDGLCDIHNKAFKLSKGEYIAILDSDDLWPDYKLEHQVKSLKKDNVALSYGECCLIDPKGRVIGYSKIPEEKAVAENFPIGSSLKEFFLKANSFIFNPTVLIKKSALNEIGGFIKFEGLAHDFTTWSTLAMKFRFKPLYKCLGYWRRHINSIVFHHATYRFLNKLKFIETKVKESAINLPGFNFTEEEILNANKNRFNEYMRNFSYDRSMLLLSLQMFKEAENEFSNYLENNKNLKNYFIQKLFHASVKLNYDLVNPLRRFKEKLIKFK